MSSLEESSRFETASTGVAFRARAYGSVERQALLRDVLGMANAPVSGPRVIFMGVRDVIGGERRFLGLSDEAINEVRGLCQSLVPQFIEPVLNVGIRSMDVDGVKIAALVVSDCENPPYLLKASVSNSLRKGAGWIRKGTEYTRMTRADLQRTFERKFLDPRGTADIQVGFPGKIPQIEVELPVLDLDELPSTIAGERLRSMLEAKDASREALGRTETRIDRLMHAKIFGEEQPYESHSAETLEKRMKGSSEEHLDADRYYRFEVRAHKLNVRLTNVGGVALDGATLMLEFPRMEGVGISDALYASPGAAQPAQAEYPIVDVGPRTTRVNVSVGQIQLGASVNAFREPPRIWLRGPSAGKTLPVDYTLYGKNLRETLTGTLRIHVVEAEASTRRSSAAG